jgi:hypothetical protein
MLNQIKLQSWVFLSVAIAGSCYLALIIGQYVLLDTYLDHALPNIAIRSWRLINGQELYYSSESLNFVAGVYGPLLYVFNGLVLWVFGGTLASSNAAGGLAVILGLAALSFHLCKTSDRDVAAVSVIMFLGVVLALSPISFWARPDPFILMLVCFALLSIHLKKFGEYVPHIAVAICIGLAVNFKAHAFLYFIPIVFRYCTKRWYISWFLMAALSILVFLLPFGLSPISLSEYLGRLFDIVGGRTVSPNLLYTATKYSTLFLLPAIVLAIVWKWARSRINVKDIIYFWAFFLSICGGIYSASVPGAGWYHLLAFIPISADLFSKFVGSLKEKLLPRTILLSIFFLTFVIISITPQKRLWKTYDRLSTMAPVSDEIRSVITRFPGQTIEMGYGQDVASTYSLTYARPLLAFAGNRTTITGPSAMELRYQGQPASSALLAHIKSCGTNLWLIPKGERPFSMNNYFNNDPAFWPKMQEVFIFAYEVKTTLKYFDVWACKK